MHKNDNILNKMALLAIFVVLQFSLMAQSDFTTSFTDRWERNKTYTLQLFDQWDSDDMTFQPQDDMRSVGDQFLHMARNMVWLSSTYIGGASIEIPEDGDRATIRQALVDAFDQTISNVESIPEDEWFTMVEMFAGQKSKAQMAFLIIDHLAHHRGQIIVYMRMKGIIPDRYVGW